MGCEIRPRSSTTFRDPPPEYSPPVLVLNRAFTGKVFISTPEDTGPAYTQMKLQHRSRAPGPPYNRRTSHTESLATAVDKRDQRRRARGETYETDRRTGFTDRTARTEPSRTDSSEAWYPDRSPAAARRRRAGAHLGAHSDTGHQKFKSNEKSFTMYRSSLQRATRAE